MLLISSDALLFGLMKINLPVSVCLNGLAVLDICLQTEHCLSLIVQLTEIVSELISLYGHF